MILPESEGGGGGVGSGVWGRDAFEFKNIFTFYAFGVNEVYHVSNFNIIVK